MDPSDLLQHWNGTVGAVFKTRSLSAFSFVYKISAGVGRHILKEVGTVNPLGDVECKLEADFAVWAYLQARGIPVALPIPADDGSRFILRDGKYYSLFPELPSGPDPGAAQEEILACIGAAIARMHLVLATYPGVIHSWTMNLPPRILDEAVPVICRHLPETEKSRLEHFIAEEQNAFRARLEGLPAQYIHGDCHTGNILVKDREVSGFIDMDHMPYGPRVYDLCYPAGGAVDEASLSPDKEADFFDKVMPGLFGGYEQVSPLTEAEKDAVPYMLMGICLIMAGWFYEPLNRPGGAETNLRMLYWNQKNKTRIRDCIARKS